MKISQPVPKHEVDLQQRRLERKSEDLMLERLKARLETKVREQQQPDLIAKLPDFLSTSSMVQSLPLQRKDAGSAAMVEEIRNRLAAAASRGL